MHFKKWSYGNFKNNHKNMNTKVESDIGQSIKIEDSDLPF